MNKFKFIIISLFFFLEIIYSQKTITALGAQGTIYPWTNKTNWDLNVVPGVNDTALIPHSIMSSSISVSVTSITIGGSTTWGALHATSHFIATKQILVYANSYVGFFGTGWYLGSDADYIFNRGSFLFLEGSEYTLIGRAVLYCFSGAGLENNGTLNLGGGSLITAPGSTLINNNYMEIGPNLLVAQQVFAPNSTTIFSDIGDGIYTQGGNLIFQKSSKCITTGRGGFLTGATVLSLEDGASLTMNAYIYDASSGIISILSLSDTSKVVSFDSTIDSIGVAITIVDNTLFALVNSNLTINDTILIMGYGELRLLQNSFINTTGFIFSEDNGLIHSENSKISVIDATFGLMNNSVAEFFQSELRITVNESTRGVLGIFNNSQLYFYDQSKFLLDGVFLVYDRSVLYLNASEFVVEYLFFLDNFSKCRVVNGSRMEILNIFAVRGQSFFDIQESTLQVTNNITFYEYPTFNFLNSTISVDGLFDYKVENSGKNTIENSNVDVNGVFSNSGNITIINSILSVYLNFSNYGNLVLQENSRIMVEDGTFYSDDLLDGSQSTIQVNNGSIVVKDESTFNCVNCNITILNGYFKQGNGASINLLNTTFNNKQGVVEAFGVISIEGGGISNDANFILRSDIIPTGSRAASVENKGTFSINGENPSSIQTPFVNSGEVHVQQDITFTSYVQSSGSLQLSSNIFSDQALSVNGGSVVGNGVINGGLDSNGGTVGSNKDMDQININGDYNQSSNSNIRVTVDDELNSSNITINGTANLSGTIYIRVNEDLVNSATENKSISVVSHASVSNTFTNVVISTYNKQTNTETIITNNCKVKTSHSGSSFALLLTPNDESNECAGNLNDGSSTTSSKSSKISKGAIIGIVVGVVGAAVIVCAIYFFKHKSDFQILSSKLKSITKSKDSTQS